VLYQLKSKCKSFQVLQSIFYPISYENSLNLKKKHISIGTLNWFVQNWPKVGNYFKNIPFLGKVEPFFNSNLGKKFIKLKQNDSSHLNLLLIFLFAIFKALKKVKK